MAPEKQMHAVGRRKTSSARVFISLPGKDADGKTEFVINDKPFEVYFPFPEKQRYILSVLETAERLNKYNIRVRVIGGGFTGQSGAVVLGLARALEKAEPELRPALKKAGFLSRDARIVERKKYGRHKARKKPQYSKR